jgi:hypothetical protein
MSPRIATNFLPASLDQNNKTSGKMVGNIKRGKAGLPQHLMTAETYKKHEDLSLHW